MDRFWLYDPMILINPNKIKEILPKNEYSMSRKLNSLTRIILLLTILAFLITRSFKVFISSILCLLVIVIMYKTKYEEKLNKKVNEDIMKEGFDNKSDKFVKILKDNFVTPTKQNPLMNVLLPEIGCNSNRPPAAPAFNKRILNEINDKSKNDDNKLYKNLGDNLVHENAMRNFYTNPNTTIPNDQKSFRDFCYGTMKSCKEVDGDGDICSKSFRKVGQHFY